MPRHAELRIDLDALCHNYAQLRSLHGGRSLAVIKADAYGHGAVRCAKALLSAAVPADALAVAFLDEALALRAAGINAPILVLEGAFDAQEAQAMHALDLWTVVHQAEQIAHLRSLPPSARLSVWMKVDTGMKRAGFAIDDVHAAWTALRDTGRVAEITLMTHFARADEPDHPFTQAQIDCFDVGTAGLPGARSLANSAGVLAWPEARRDWGRPGIALYGASPLPGPDKLGLKPVMSLHSQVFAVRHVNAGEAVGYGGRWIAPRHSRIGLVAMGYADGYPRMLAEDTPVAVDGTLTRLAGRVSMDMITVDLTDLPASGVGSQVEFWGQQVPINTIARAAGTISYELMCHMKRARVRVHTPADSPHHGVSRMLDHHAT